MKHNGDCQDEKEHVIWGGFKNNIMHMSGNDNCNARYDVTLCLQQHMQWPIRWDKKMHAHASSGSLVQWFVFPRHYTYLKKKCGPINCGFIYLFCMFQHYHGMCLLRKLIDECIIIGATCVHLIGDLLENNELTKN